MQTALTGERAFLLNEINKRFDELPTPQQAPNFAQNLKLEMPIFRGEPNERPVRFINALRQYCEGMNVPQSRLKLLLEQSLKNLAHDWFVFNQDLINSPADFERLFLEQYWSNSIQCSIKRNFDRACYEAKDNLSRAEYVIRWCNDLRDLTTPPTEQMMIDTFSRHFDQQVQDAIGVRGINSIQGLINLLNSLDNQIGLNASNENIRRVDFNNVSIAQRSPPQPRQYNNSYNNNNSNHLPTNSNNTTLPFRTSTPNNHHNNYSNNRSYNNNNTSTPRYNTNNNSTYNRQANNPLQVNEISINEIPEVEEPEMINEDLGTQISGN